LTSPGDNNGRVFPLAWGNNALDGTSTGPAANLAPNDEIDGLNVTTADDPRLGLTSRPGKPAKDWAANTGPARNPK